MSQDGQILDLDAVARPDKRVVFEGGEYRLPGDPPSGLVVRMHTLQAALRDAEQSQDREQAERTSDELRETVHELFSLRQQIASDFLDGFSFAQIAQVFYFAIDLYQPPDPPTKPKAPKPKSSRRSGSSSKRGKSRS